MSQEQDNNQVSQVKETVKQQLFRRIIKQATSELSSIDDAELSARLGEMNPETEMSALQERLKERVKNHFVRQVFPSFDELEASVDGMVTTALNEGEALEEISARIQHEIHGHVVAIINKKIAAAASEPGRLAGESREQLSEEIEPIDKASYRLLETLIDEIMTQSVASLDNADATAKDVISRIDPEHDVLPAARKAVRERMTERNNQEALKELSLDGKTGHDSSEQAFLSRNLQTQTSGMSPEKEEDHALDENVEAAESATTGPERDSFGEVARWTLLSELETAIEDQAEAAPISETEAESNVHETDDPGDGLSFTFEEACPTEQTTSIEAVDSDAAVGDGLTAQDLPMMPVPAKADGTRVYYVYGILSSEYEYVIDAESPKGMTDTSRVFVINGGKLSAIVSLEDEATFGPRALERNMRDTEWLKDMVRRHAAILFEVKKVTTLVPIRFGICCSCEEEIMQLIAEQRTQFKKTIERLHGKAEYSVRVYCDMQLLFGAISTSKKSVDASLEDMPRGVSRFLKGMLDEDGSSSEYASSGELLETCIRRSHGTLLEMSAEGTFKQVANQQDSQGRDLVMNTAYLVPTYMERQFAYTIERLATEYEELGLAFEQSGPWPPFHFVGSNDSDDLDSVGGIRSMI